MDNNTKIIKRFGSQELEVLRIDIQSALDIIKTKYGLSEFTLERIYFTNATFNAKISGKTQNTEADDFEKNEAAFFALRYGLPENLLNTEFKSDWQSFTISRIETKNTKYPVIAHCPQNGKIYKFSVQQIKQALEKKQTP